MKYQLVEFNKLTGVLTVNYYPDGVPNGIMLGVTIPKDVNGNYVTNVDEIVQQFAPTHLTNGGTSDSSLIDNMVTASRAATDRPVDATISNAKRELTNAINGGFTFNGKTYPCDATFQLQLSSFVTAWNSGTMAADAKVNIRTYDNYVIKMGKAEIVALQAAIMNYIQAAYQKYWAAKDAASAG